MMMKDKILGCLMTGAVGDALGYAVEFLTRDRILAEYGQDGITEFDLDEEGKAVVSDDTQMTLFTAVGMKLGCDGNLLIESMKDAYLDWFYTQMGMGQQTAKTWLRDVPEMNLRRAPGSTCLSACDSLLRGNQVINNSKGCGGIMRVSPVALFWAANKDCFDSEEEMVKFTALSAELTHKHPLGFIPAAALSYLIYKLLPLSIEDAKQNIEKIIEDTMAKVRKIFAEQYPEEVQYFVELTQKACSLARQDVKDNAAITMIGEGWVGEEAWAIALYCTMKHIDNVEDAIKSAVNHSGDSDSTGSVCGNIMGSIYGFKHIKDLNLFCPKGHDLAQTIDLYDVILKVVDEIINQ